MTPHGVKLKHKNEYSTVYEKHAEKFAEIQSWLYCVGDVVAHWQSTRLWMQQSRVQIPGIPLKLAGKNKGWSESAVSTTSMAA